MTKIGKLAPHGAVLLIAGALMVGAAHARMYQWQSPATGSVQLSGEPPAWYRSTQQGPRVRVFDGANLVDDTSIALPNSQREELRADAFRESEQRQRDDALKRLERVARQQERRRTESERLQTVKSQTEREVALQARSSAVGIEPEAETPLSSISPDETLDEATVARLKAIIGDFDRRNSAQ